MNITPKSEFNLWFKQKDCNTAWVYYRIDSDEPSIQFSKEPIGFVTFECMTDATRAVSFIQKSWNDTADLKSMHDIYNMSWAQNNDTISATDYTQTTEYIGKQFELFCKTRPEATLWTTDSVSAAIQAAQPYLLVSVYDEMLTGALLLLNSETSMSDERAIKVATRATTWLNETDFYEAPGSTQYHDSHPRGLLIHSLRVAYEIMQLHTLPKFSNTDVAKAVYCALVHDWCKINKYEQYMRNVKNEETGVWEKIPSYRYRDAAVPLGHGETSMFLAGKFTSLTAEMACAIRWHMGAWQMNPAIINDLQQSNETYPLVLMLQFADQLSITQY